MKNKKENAVNPEDKKGIQHPKSTSDREHKNIKDSKTHTIPNSGGQTANQTDNKQGTVNRGNQSSEKRGKKD